MNNTQDQINADKQQPETKIIEHGPIAEIDQASEAAAVINGEAVVTAIAVESDGDVIDHLRECQCDHDEIDAARAQTERADDKGIERGGCDRPLHKTRADALLGQNPNRVTTDSQIGRMAEAYHSAKPHDQI